MRPHLFASLLIALLFSFITANTAQAEFTGTTATIDGQTSVTALANGSLNIHMEVDYNFGTDWDSTAYRFGNGTWLCTEDSGDHSNSNSGDNEEDFSLNAPAATGTYTLQLRPHSEDACTLGSAAPDNRIASIQVNVITPQANPDLAAVCGLDVILVLDESYSIVSPTNYAPNVRTAAKAFLDGLLDTGSRVAIVEFNGQARQAFGYTPVTAANLVTLKNYIDDSGNPPQGGGYNPNEYSGNDYYTNWDDAFAKVEILNNTSVAPLVVFMTDGDPTTYANNPERDTSTTYSATDRRLVYAIEGANAVKNQGSHILTVGVGAGLSSTGSQNRLKQISGNDTITNISDFNAATTDLMLVSNFSNLPTALRQIITALCQSSVTITKVVDPGTGVYQPAAGWNFSAAARYPEANGTSFTWVQPHAATATQVVSGTTAVNGTINFQWKPNAATGTSRISITETVKSGYTFEGAVCLKSVGGGTPTSITATKTGNSFSLTGIETNAAVTCQVKNKFVVTPALSIDKTGSVGPLTIGQMAQYTITVQNTGNVTLTNVTVTDAKLNLTRNVGTLTVNQSKVVTGTYGPIKETDLPGPVNNTASAMGTTPINTTVGPVTDTHTIPLVINPGLAIDKTGSAGPLTIGNMAQYTITVTNTGNVTLTNVTVTDAKLKLTKNVGTVKVGQSSIVTGTYGPIKETDLPGPIFNTAGVTGTTPINTPVGPVTDTHTIPLVINPALTIDKTGTTGPLTIGQMAQYTITVTNTGNVTLTNVTVTDAKLNLTKNVGTVKVGQSSVVTGTYGPIKETDLPGPVNNTASAVGTTPINTTVGPVTDTHTIPLVINPALTIDKTGSAGPLTIGNMAQYTITVTNTGNVTLTNVTVTDAKLNLTKNVGTLTVSQSKVVTGTYGPIKETDLPGPVNNTASAVGTTPTNTTVGPVTDTHTIPLVINPALTIDKTGSAGPLTIGQLAQYTITVQNTGNVTLTNVTVTDAKLGLTKNVGTVKVGQSAVVTGTYGPIKETDLPGPIFNTAGAVGTTPINTPVGPVTDTHTIPLIINPALTLVKTGSAGPLTIGNMAQYTITVQNTGNVTLTNVTVTDAKLGLTKNVGTLVVNQSSVVTGTYGPIKETDLPGPILNTASAVGTTPTNTTVGPVTDDHTIPLTINPALTIVKTGDTGPVTIGSTIKYTITVQNSGNVKLLNVTVTDAKLGLVQNVGTLEVGQSAQLAGNYGPVTEADLPGPIFNAAGATGTTPIGTPVGPVTDTHEVPVTINPALTIVKTGDAGPVTIGSTVHYTITVQNSGNVTLNNVTVTDEKLGLVQNVGTLTPGQSAQVTGSYGPVEESDLPGPIFNTAGVTGTTPINTPVGPVTDTHEVPVTVSPALTIVKTGDAGPVTIGSTVHYTITVQNSGNVTLYNVTVTDEKLALVQNVGTLTPGQSAQVTGNYGPVTEADLPGPIFNTASAVGTTPTNTTVGPVTDTHEVPVIVNPGLEIEKTGDVGPVAIGSIVHYTITVRNVGNVTINNVVVTDAKLNLTQNVGTLAPGQSAQVTGNYGPVTETDLPGPIFNAAGATGTTPIGTPVGPVTDTHEVPIFGNLSALGDKVWFDENQDGLQSQNEIGVANVKVDLYTEAGLFVATTTTNDQGEYFFPGLAAGAYYVEFATPQGFNLTKSNVDSNQDALDSDVPMPWLTLGASDGGEEAELGEHFTYTFFYTNTDSSNAATNVLVSTVVLPGTKVLPAEGTPGWSCTDENPGGVCTFTLPTLAANATGSMTFVVLISSVNSEVPDQLDLLVTLTQGTLARSQVVNLGVNETNPNVDAGLVRIEANLRTATPTESTNLEEGEQPDQPKAGQIFMFLPTVQAEK